jgi:hypothetical protein
MSRTTSTLACCVWLLSGFGCVYRAAPRDAGRNPLMSLVPLVFTGHDKRYPTVSATIGAGDYQLMLDTGAAHGVSLTRQALTRLDVDFTGKTMTYRDAYGGVHHARRFLIPSMTLGSLELTDVPGSESDGCPYGLDGTLGLGFLRRFDLVIDYAAGRLALLKGGSTGAEPAGEAWFQSRYDGDLAVTVRFPCIEGSYVMVLDSGCGCTLVSGASKLGRRLQSALREEPREILYDGITGKEYSSYEIDHLYLGGYDLGKNRLAIGDVASYIRDGLLGFDVFHNNLVYVNFRRKEIWLAPTSRERGTSRPEALRVIGIALELSATEAGVVSTEVED